MEKSLLELHLTCLWAIVTHCCEFVWAGCLYDKKNSIVHGVSIRLCYCSSPVMKGLIGCWSRSRWRSSEISVQRTILDCQLFSYVSKSRLLECGLLWDWILNTHYPRNWMWSYLTKIIFVAIALGNNSVPTSSSWSFKTWKVRACKTLQASKWQSSPAPNVLFVSKSYWTTPTNWTALNKCTQC